MTDDNSTPELVDTNEDLDTFSADFFGTAKPKEEVEVEVEEDVETGEDTPAPESDTDAEEEEVPAEDEDVAEEEASEEEEEAPKDKRHKKTDYQTRINELTRARREAERRTDELLKRLETLEQGVHKDTKQVPVKEQLNLPEGAPTPDALDDEGNPKYSLGEFDPLFIRDLTRFTIAEESKLAETTRIAQAEAAKVAEAKNELKASWSTKLDSYEESVPEIRENIAELVENFSNLDPAYGEYIAMTLMQCENGPAIMDYLSQNIGEAQKIVASGPAAATLAIGRLEARFTPSSVDKEDKSNMHKKVSVAPDPPKTQVRGSGSRTTTRDDTDDQDAFEKKFFIKK